jgi:hypothetical protein
MQNSIPFHSMGSACSSQPTVALDDGCPTDHNHQRFAPSGGCTTETIHEFISAPTTIPQPQLSAAPAAGTGAQYQTAQRGNRSVLSGSVLVEIRSLGTTVNGGSSNQVDRASNRNPLADLSASFALDEVDCSRSAFLMNSSTATGVLSLGFDPPLASRVTKTTSKVPANCGGIGCAASPAPSGCRDEFALAACTSSDGDPLQQCNTGRGVTATHECRVAHQQPTSSDEGHADGGGSLDGFLVQRAASIDEAADEQSPIGHWRAANRHEYHSHHPLYLRSPSLPSSSGAMLSQQPNNVVALLKDQSQWSLRSEAIGVAGAHTTSSVWSVACGGTINNLGASGKMEDGHHFGLPAFHH